MLTLHNFSDKPQVARIRVGVKGGETLLNLLVNEECRGEGKGTSDSPGAHGYRCFRVGPHTQILEAPKE